MIFGSSEAAKKFIEELEREESGEDSRTRADSLLEHSRNIDGQIVTDSEEEGETDDDEGDGKELFDSAALAALLKAATGGDSNGGSITITSQDGSRLFSVERPAGLGSSLQSLRPAPRTNLNRPSLFGNLVPAGGGESEENLSEEEKKKLEKLQQIRVKFLRLVHRLGLSPEESMAAQVLYRLALLGGRQNTQTFSLDAAKRTALQLEAEEKDDLDFSVNILVLGKSGVGKSATINSIFGEEKAQIDAFENGTVSVKEISGLVDGVKVRKKPTDVVLYVDRLDAQSRDLNDLPLLKTVTSVLGSTIWRSAIVTLTHSASAPPSIGHAVGDLRMMSPSLMNPVSLVENHPSCRKNRDGHKILPNGQIWRPQLLLLCYSMKILSEASSLSKPQDPFEEEDEYDQLPPFKPLKKAQIAKLSREQRNAYYEEFDYRVKLLQKKQWREELRRMREFKKRGNNNNDNTADYDDEADAGAAAQVAVPLPDMALPPSFDGDNPAYRYRFLEPTSQFLARPVLDTHGWDHDCGYDGVNLEHSLPVLSRFPAVYTVQITKDKKDFTISLDSSMGKQLAYIFRAETKIKNLRRNKATGGISFTILGDNVVPALKVEDQINLGKRYTLVGSAGVVKSQQDTAYGANFEVQRREDDYPIGQVQSTMSLSVIKWRGDLALGFNIMAQLAVGRNSKVAVRAGLNNKMSGQITVRTSSSEHLSLALAAVIPTVLSVYKKLFPAAGEKYSIY
ncbi:translocase of chloroplast 159 chloroplastic [Phtheirospermum japonicum]|uniref:Translocase of chloroplast 159 chloroplastic n=1 Tax=Phtheirospermum japonicum TaxID=374723 RepID=A0A830BJK5_9LAMI|nr:translocase of chloroplast 159 chloroplastic [Phtheirospermum japonicum]